MLQLKDICKTYVTGELKQTALDHVSLSLRDNEFVAILGPSGSGKTTMLNIIGGLDRYDSGDLIINATSTKNYKDRDWDSYRNHTIGFVFQSYNLIPHQTILSNVELALTISGISGSERTRRAKEALEKVGLGNQVHKKPNQLSGGQMQRVAIARALVNDPDILLADEPTGALDTETSIQVMDLLKEVASDRLVVMVTHNPELAEDYATRIVRLKDGKIISDTDPYIVNEEQELDSKNLGRSSMSFLTALQLSFNNLRTKMARTVLVSFAGSIGIIGIALILSLSTGVNQYIKNIEEDTLSEYPVQVLQSSFDFSAMVEQPETDPEDEEGKVKERQTISRMFSRISKNDLKSLREYLESPDSGVYDYAKAIEYSYDLSPLIYQIYGDTVRQVNPDVSFASLGMNQGSTANPMMTAMMSTDIFHAMPEEEDLYIHQYDIKAGRWPENDHECVLVLSPMGRVTDFAMYSMGFRDPAELEKMIRNFAENETTAVTDSPLLLDYSAFLDVSFKLVNYADFYQYDEQYKVWKDKREDTAYVRQIVENGEDLKIVGVVQPKDDDSAAMLSMGICYPPGLIGHAAAAANESAIVQSQLNNKEINVFTGKSFDDRESSGFDMSKMFTIDTDAMANAFSFDGSALNIDFSGFDLSGAIDPSAMNLSIPVPENIDLAEIMKNVDVKVDLPLAAQLFQDVAEGYLEFAKEDPATDYTKIGPALQKYMSEEEVRQILEASVQDIINENDIIVIDEESFTAAITDIMSGYAQWAAENEKTDPDASAQYLQEYLNLPETREKIQNYVNPVIESLQNFTVSDEQLQKLSTKLYEGYCAYARANELPDPEQFTGSVQTYMEKEEVRTMVMDGVRKAVNTDEIMSALSAGFTKAFAGYADTLSASIQSSASQMMDQISGAIAAAMSSQMASIANAMQGAFRFDADAFKNAVQIGFSEDELRELLASMMTSDTASYASNLTKLGYADLSEPYVISVYPRDFDGKEKILNIIDRYNTMMTEAKMDEKVITYTDMVGTLMSSVTNIVDTISYVLIAFVAVSLIVSSIMIGIITYISVLERIKEIGILRAIGASKRNISEVFNAETFIIGLLSGLMGIGITYALLVPINRIIHSVSDNPNVNAFLPASSAVILVIISVILTLIGGFIPSKKAARKDPVEALRSE